MTHFPDFAARPHRRERLLSNPMASPAPESSHPLSRFGATSSQQHGKQTCRVWPVGGLTGTARIERQSNARPTAKLIPMPKRLGSETRSPVTQGPGDITTRELRPARSAEMPSRSSARPAKPFHASPSQSTGGAA